MDNNRQKLIDLLTEKHAQYKEVFTSPSGLKVIKDLEDKYYINKSTSGKDEQIDMFTRGMREGERTVVLYIKNMISDEQLKQIGDKDVRS